MSVFNRIIKHARGITFAAALGLAAQFGCGIHPDDSVKCYPVGYCGNYGNGGGGGGTPPGPTDPVIPPLVITSTPVPGYVNSEYSYQLTTNRPAQCSLLLSPPWMSIQNNELYGYPWHISNPEVGIEKVIARCTDGKKNAYQVINLQIDPGEYCRLDWMQTEICGVFDVVHPVDSDGDSINDITLVCETGDCPDFFRENRQYMERRALGIKAIAKETADITGVGFLDVFNPPVTVYLNARTNPSSTNPCGNPAMLGENYSNNVICDYLYDWIASGTQLFGMSSCLDNAILPDGTLKYPEACINPSTYIKPATVGANGIIGHEYDHLINRGQFPRGMDEMAAFTISTFASGSYGLMPLDSIGDLPYSIYISPNAYGLFYSFYQNYGFDVQHFPLLYKIVRTEFERGFPTGDYASNRPVNHKVHKCADDAVMTYITSQQTNTYDEYVANVCNNPDPFFRDYCSTNPESYAYVDPSYCGDQYLPIISSTSNVQSQ